MISDRAAKRLQTKIKRKSQKCKVFEVKIDRSKLSKETINYLVRLFVEAKWYYNYVISHKKINDAETKIKVVPVKVGDIYENRTLNVLTAQMRQDIKARTFGSLKALKALKEQGFKVGWLKFKSRVNSIPLRQLNKTYYLRKSEIKIQGLNDWMRVRGLEQLGEKEIANAVLVRKCNDYYLHVTTFEDKVELNVPEASIGIDFGCETQLTFSNGIKVEFQVPPTRRLRRLDRRIMRKQHNGKKRAHSRKKRQDEQKRQKEYERITNRKGDIRHKLVHAITHNYKYVCFQDESIHAWHSGNHGKKVQHSGIGGIIRDLKNKAHTPVMVDKFFPSTQLCPRCGNRKKLELKERVYECDCGFVEDRDVKSAECIENEGMKLIVPVDYRDLKAREILSTAFLGSLMAIRGIRVSKTGSMN
jgi:putative transposase